MALLLSLLSGALFAETRYWTGAGADELASNPANWSGGVAPMASDEIVLETTSHKSMTWNMANMTVASWTQAGYLGTVTVATVYNPAGFTNLNITGDCIISNGMWTHADNAAQEANRLRVHVGGNFVIGTNGTIDATGKGYDKNAGLGAGSAGGYGGHGRQPGHAPSGGLCYGSITAPTNIGSGGGLSSGGGAIYITVAGVISNNGLIRANGAPVNYYSGSGGGIYIVAGAMAGAGTIEANGGYGVQSEGGGGGRIALVVTNDDANFNLYTGSVHAYSGGGNGGAGTVYLETPSAGAGRGTLLIDAGGGSHNCTEINTNVIERIFATVVIQNGGNFGVATNHSIEVSGIWSNKATFTGFPGSSVVFSDRYNATSVIYGASTFACLIATNAGTTLLFEPGKTNRFAAGNSLVLRGSDSVTNLFLRSISPGQKWKIYFDGAAKPSVLYADLQDSDASPGAQAIAFHSRDSGGNINWIFSSALPGITNVWTGAASTLWSVGANWESGRAPLNEDYILIPGGLATYPVINGSSRIVAGITVESGASLKLNGYGLTVNDYATLAGTLTCASNETVVFCGDVDFTGGEFHCASSTVIFSGDAPQTVAPAGRTFYTIVVDNTNAVTFTGGFSAYAFLSEPPGDEMREMVFQSGAAIQVDFLTLLSACATTNIILRASNAGVRWRLAAVQGHSIRGVDARDCDAGSGPTIYASGSRDSGNNVNWSFDQSWVEWTRAGGNDLFSNAANWWPPAVPGEGDWVRVANALPVTSAEPVTIRNLFIGGGSGTAQMTANAALNVIENVKLYKDGTLLLNSPSVVGSNLDILAGALLSHSGNTVDQVNALNLRVCGNMAVHSNGSVNVSTKGHSSGNGPGRSSGSRGASHGGRGTPSNESGPCYGSVIAPTNLGSGSSYGGGGGAILLAVSGELRHDGLICADAVPGMYANGSGGSIWITSGAMLGTGIIRAAGSWGAGSGGGGRISLVVTNKGANLQGFTGLVTAYGGGGGTIYIQNAADGPGRGTALVNNNSSGHTDVPPGPPCVTNEAEFIAFHVTNSAILRLTDDFMLGDIFLKSANSKLDLGFHTLTVRSREHALGVGSVINEGKIIWWPDIPRGSVFAIW